MHELSIANAVLATARAHAEDQPVALVAMRVGTLRQVVPASLRFYWEIVTRGTPCDGATLELTVVQTRLRCEDCGHQWKLLAPSFRCPECSSAAVHVTAGEELEIEFLELKEPAHA
jgi:hydrogenase nickel incorporation protein HypA/HybF